MTLQCFAGKAVVLARLGLEEISGNCLEHELTKPAFRRLAERDSTSF